MKLTFMERLLILSLLPKEGDVSTIRILNTLKIELGATEEEHKKLNIRNIKNTDGTSYIQWDQVMDTLVEIAIGDKAREIITEALRRLDSERKITADHLSLWDKFEMDKIETKVKSD